MFLVFIGFKHFYDNFYGCLFFPSVLFCSTLFLYERSLHLSLSIFTLFSIDLKNTHHKVRDEKMSLTKAMKMVLTEQF